MKKTIIALALLSVVGIAPAAAAQQEEREQERREEAQRRLEEVQRQLEQALQQLREAQTDEARRGLEEAMAALRAAMRELQERRAFEVITGARPGGVRVFSYGGETPQVAVFGDDRPRIGVLVQTDRNEETDPVGARLTAVTPGGPADEAGLEAGDIVTEANGVSLAATSRRDNPGERFIDIVRELDEGDDLRITYRRDGETHTAVLSPRVMESDSFFYSFRDSMDVWAPRLERMDPEIFIEPRTLRVEPRTLTIEPSEMIARIALPHRWLNIELVTLDEDLGSYFGTAQGLLVIRAPRDEDLGLLSGDVILEINGRAPTGPSHALRILRSYEEGETVTMQIMRQRNRRTIEFTVPERDRDFR